MVAHRAGNLKRLGESSPGQMYFFLESTRGMPQKQTSPMRSVVNQSEVDPVMSVTVCVLHASVWCT